MAPGASNVLVAGITNLFTGFLVFLGMREEHIFRVRQVMAGAIVAEALAMALVTFLFLDFGGGAVGDGPTVGIMRSRRGAYDDGRFEQDLAAAAGDGHAVAQVAFGADGIPSVIRGTNRNE
jgi:hypothetical protein